MRPVRIYGNLMTKKHLMIDVGRRRITIAHKARPCFRRLHVAPSCQCVVRLWIVAYPVAGTVVAASWGTNAPYFQWTRTLAVSFNRMFRSKFVTIERIDYICFFTTMLAACGDDVPCQDERQFNDQKVVEDRCWAPPERYCAQGASLMQTKACSVTHQRSRDDNCSRDREPRTRR